MLGFFRKKKFNEFNRHKELIEKQLSSLDPTDPCVVLDTLTKHIDPAINDQNLPLDEKTKLILFIEDKGDPLLRRLERGIASGVRISKSIEEKYRESSGRFLNGLRHSWSHLATVTKGTPQFVTANARTIAGIRRNNLWNSFFYVSNNKDSLIQAGKIYSDARNEGWEGDPTEEGDHIQSTSVVGELVKMLTSSLSSYGGLSPAQIYLSEHIIDILHTSFSFRLSRQTESTFCFSPRTGEKPARILNSDGAFPDGTVFIDMYGARQTLDAWVRSSDDGVVPERIAVEHPAATPSETSFILKHLIGQWFFDAAARKHQRYKASIRLDVVGGTDNIFEHFSKETPKDAEAWTCHNISIGGFAATFDKKTEDWLKIGALIAVHAPNKSSSEWGVGIVRRMQRKDGGYAEVAVELFSHNGKRGIISTNDSDFDCISFYDSETKKYRIITKNRLFVQDEKTVLTTSNRESIVLSASSIIELWSEVQMVEYSFFDANAVRDKDIFDLQN